MVEIPDQVYNIINKYIELLEENDIPVKIAILFGSYANGRATEWSDIDLAIVSDSFDGVRIDDRSKIRKVTLAVSSDLSPLPFRPEDFIRDDPFVKEIIEKGIRIV